MILLVPVLRVLRLLPHIATLMQETLAATQIPTHLILTQNPISK